MPHGIRHICSLNFLLGLLNDIRLSFAVIVSVIPTAVAISSVIVVVITVFSTLTAISRGLTYIELVNGFFNIGLLTECDFARKLRELFKPVKPSRK